MNNKKEYRPVASLILSRKEDGRDYFLIVKKPRKNHAWQFPQGGQDAGEELATTAVRELQEECGASLEVKFLQSLPLGSYQYDFPADFQRSDHNFRGAKVSFFRAELVAGKVEIDEQEIVDYKWIFPENFADFFADSYLEFIKTLKL